MTADSGSGCLVDRLFAAIDRLEVALEASRVQAAEAGAAAAVLKAMADDRAALAARLDAAQVRAAKLEAAAAAAGVDREVADAARAVREALRGGEARGGETG